MRVSTDSAFTQSRAKINYTAFEETFQKLTKYYYANFKYDTYCGKRLIAIDGTVLTLPRTKETIKEFGDNVLSENKKWIKAQVSFASDVLNNICLDADIKAYRTSEKDMASVHINRLESGNLYIFDRGYFSRQMLWDINLTECDFCFRVRKNACSEVINFIESGSHDTICEIKTPKKPVLVRITKIELDSEQDEYLVTSLIDTKRFKKTNLKFLYHQRWGVEEQYKDFKHAICIENFVGKKVNSIKQEFFSNILSYNLAMMLGKKLSELKANLGHKYYTYKVNKRALLAKYKQCFVEIFTNDNLSNLLETIIENVAKESVPIRENRSFERGKTMKVKKKFSTNYISAI